MTETASYPLARRRPRGKRPDLLLPRYHAPHDRSGL